MEDTHSQSWKRDEIAIPPYLLELTPALSTFRE